jgi:hypothetical protein
MISVQTICGNCGAARETLYVLLGAAAECASCGTRAVPRVPAGATYPRIRYELTFADFRRLVSDTDYSPSVAPLLRRWFGYELEASAGGDARVREGDGRGVDLLSLHLCIQGDAERQSALYRTAMTLWR